MDLESTYDINLSTLLGVTDKLVGFTDHVELVTNDGQKEELNLLTVSTSYGWKLKDSFPSKVISITEESILLEIVKDAETKATEERIFPISFFTGYEVQEGKFFKLQLFERPNATMIQVSPGVYLTDDDFPQLNFEKFSKRSVFD